MNKVALLIGGNQGDRRAMIEQATVLIQDRIGTVVAVSGIYETEPWGTFETQAGETAVASFFNRALLVETPLDAHSILRSALDIEAVLGRVRPSHAGGVGNRLYHSRPMDIDLIFFNEDVIDTPDLHIPHPRMHLRRFVLEPLAEIMPDYRHPLLGLTVKQMLDTL
jgi:2-amino-4-hydroxy-6-hydroxymethyldihydropteridine diphosphokinase